MTDSAIEKELAAIRSIANTLKPFEPDARRRVLQYATQHLGIVDVPTGKVPAAPTTPAGSGEGIEGLQAGSGDKDKIVDIRRFKEEKNPKSDVQMAAVVAYYLAKLAPEELRQDSIMADDIEKYFDQGGYRLPRNSSMTLVNAKNAGYLDPAGHGKYKINPVGHNLVVHNLPKSDASKPVKRSRPKKARRKNAAGGRAAKPSSAKAR